MRNSDDDDDNDGNNIAFHFFWIVNHCFTAVFDEEIIDLK